MASTKKAYKGMAMEGALARWYARNTRRDTGRFQAGAQAVAERTGPSAEVLEVAPGPGYLAIEIAKSGRRVSAVDISRSFVEMVRANAHNAGVEVDVRHGDAAAIPFPADSFDFVVSMAAFKNFADPIGALNEIHRVLKPGGRASIFDLRRDARREDIDAEVAGMGMSPWNSLLTRWIFRFGLLKRAYRGDELGRLARLSRFGGCEVATRGIGFELHLAK